MSPSCHTTDNYSVDSISYYLLKRIGKAMQNSMHSRGFFSSSYKHKTVINEYINF
jgi:hypothetical protein